MAAPKENQFWKARSSHGRKPFFEDGEQLWTACVQYFEWVDANPLLVTELIKFQGQGTLCDVPKPRPMTQAGLCNFLDIAEETWREWKHSREDLSGVITRVEQIIYQQKFEGAAADIFNANIISRDLGLADKQEHTAEIQPRTLSDFYNMTDEEAAGAYADTLREQDEDAGR